MHRSIHSGICALMLLLTLGAWCDPLLHAGDRVLFVGDSYMGQHGCTALVMDAVSLHHPGMEISFRTVYIRTLIYASNGIPQAYLPPSIASDILQVKPTVVLVNFGLEKLDTRPLEKLGIFPRFFVQPLTALVTQCQAAGAKVIMVTPGGLDLEKHPELKSTAAPDNLAMICKTITEIAAKTHVQVIDLSALMNDVLARGKAAAPGFALTQADDSLNDAGQAVVAGAYLRALGEEGLSAGVTIDAAAGTAQAEHCTVTELKTAADAVTFTRRDDALPAYFPPNAVPVLAYDAPLQAQEQYPLKITGLRAGKWKVTVGGIDAGSFSSEELAAGVNLAQRPGPWQTLGAHLHRLAAQQETLYADRCNTLTHIIMPKEAEPERLALLQKVDDYIDLFEKTRRTIAPAARTWGWEVTVAP